MPRDNLLDMPVGAADLDAAARSYQGILEAIGGAPLRFDIVQLGLGVDGHTASLVPGDPVLDSVERDVAVSGEYQGTRRMTLTLAALSRARQRLWLVTGADEGCSAAGLDRGHRGDTRESRRAPGDAGRGGSRSRSARAGDDRQPFVTACPPNDCRRRARIRLA